MSDPQSDADKPRVVGGHKGFSPEILAEVIGKLPPEIQKIFEGITFDIRVDLDSLLEKPYRPVSLLEQLALASCSMEDAAYAIVLLTDDAEQGLFRSLERRGQEQMLRWVLKGFFPSGELPEGLWSVLELYLRPEPSASADMAATSGPPEAGVQPGP